MNSIQEWWDLLSSTEKVFWLIGGIASALLIVQTLLSMIGFDADTDADFDGADLSGDFTVFSFKSMMAFLAFFGWMGVVGLGRGWTMGIVLVAAAGAGLVAMVMVAYMLFQFQKLETSGTMRIEDALLKEGEVYLTIPALGEGTGMVSMEVSGSIRELSAVSSGSAIRTGEKIKVVDIIDDHVLLVEPIKVLESPE